MRRPTPLAEQLAWWRNAVANADYSRNDDLPRCGWFMERASRGSKTWLPARIWLHQEIDWQTGELLAPERFVLETVARTLTDELTVAERSLFLRPVSLDEWRWLTARHALHGTPLGPYVDAF